MIVRFVIVRARFAFLSFVREVCGLRTGHLFLARGLRFDCLCAFSRIVFKF